MKTNFQQAQTFLVLVPHRDVRLKLRKWSGSLFMAGIQGAYHFPWAAPLALLTRPLDTPELKHCARILRDTAGGVKISARECSCAALPLTGKDRPVIFGPRLDLALPPNVLANALGGKVAANKTAALFSPLVLGSCVLSSVDAELPTPLTVELPPAPEISFRAAAVANMKWRPLRASGESQIECGYQWKIGELCWLPAVRNKV